DGITTLATPFTNVARVEPPPDSTVATDAAFVVTFNRDTALATVDESSVFLESVEGVRAPATLRLGRPGEDLDPDDPDVPTNAWTLTPDGLLGETDYRLVVTDAVRDRKGGAMLAPFVGRYRTAAAGAVQPRIESIRPAFAAPGDTVEVRGTGFAAGVRVLLGSVEAELVVRVDETTLQVTAPASLETGSLPVRIENLGGLVDVAFGRLLLLDRLEDAALSFDPEAGPRVGGTAIRISADRDVFAPGARVVFRGDVFDEETGEVEGVQVDVQSPRAVRVLAPRADRAGLAELLVGNAEGALLPIGVWSYDLPPAPAAIELPGYPPRQAVDLRVEGDLLYVASGEPSGLELFDIRIAARPLRLGSVDVPGPVRGLLPLGDLVLLAAGAAGFVVVDASDPTQLFVIDRGASDGSARAVRERDGVAFVAVANEFVDGGGLLQRFDLRTPRLTLLSETPLPLEPLDLEVVGPNLYVLGFLDGDPTLAVLDADSGALLGEPLTLSMEMAPEGTPHLRVVGGFAFVSLEDRLLVLDVAAFADRSEVTATTRPEEVFFATPDDVLRGIDLVGSTVFVAGEAVELVNVPVVNVVSVAPADGDTAVVDSDVVVRFSRPIKASTVTPDAVTLEAADGTPVAPELDAEGLLPVTFTTFGSFLTFRPLAPLAPDTEYTLRVADRVTDITTRPLAGDFTSRFRTAADPGARRPGIVSSAPRFGPVTGGTAITVRAQRLQPGFAIELGGRPAALLSGPDVVGQDEAGEDLLELVIEAPPLATSDPGAAALELRNPGGLAALRLGAFVYLPNLAIESIEPASGPPAGGNGVTIRGRGFLPGTRVLFGDADAFPVQLVEAGNVTVRSTEELTARVPAVPAGGIVRADVQLRAGDDPAVRDTLPDGYTYTLPIAGRLVAELGPVTSLVVDDAVAFAGSVEGPPRTFSVLDISDPVAPRIISDETGSRGQILLAPGGVSVDALARLGDDRILAATETGVVAVDVSLPAAPAIDAALSDGLATAGRVVGVAVVDDLVLAADDVDGLVLFDTGLFENALRLVAVDPGGTPRALGAAPDAALVSVTTADERHFLRILDLTDPDLPLLSSQELAGPGVRLRVVGNEVFVAEGPGGVVQIFEFSSRALPVPRGFLRPEDLDGDGATTANDVEVVGSLAFVAAGGDGLQIFDVSDRAAPVRIRFAGTDGEALSVGTLGNTIVVGVRAASGEGTVQVVRLDGVNVLEVEPGLRARVPQETAVRIDLTGFVDPAEVDADSVFLTELVDDDGDGIEAEDGPVVAASLESEPAVFGTRIRLLPSAPLEAGRGYRIHVTPELLDLRGNPILAPFRSRFRVSDLPGAVQPRVEATEPAFGPFRGGDELLLIGRGFRPGAAVTIGGVPVTVLSVSPDGEELRVLAPALPGFEARDVTPLAVRVENPGGLADTRIGAYNVLPAPVLTGVEPDGARTVDPLEVTLRGVGFFPGTRVEVGGIPVAVTALLGSGTLRFAPPDGRILGATEVRVTTPSPGGDLVSAPIAFEMRLAARATLDFEAAVGLAPLGTSLFVAGGDQGLREVTVIDAGNPQAEGELGLGAPVTDVAAAATPVGRRVLALAGTRVHVVDADESGLPRDLGEVPLPEQSAASAVAAVGDLGLVVVDGTLAQLRLDDPAHPVIGHYVPASGSIVAVFPDDERLLLVVADAGGDRIEVRDLTTPSLDLLGQLASDTEIRDLALGRELAAIATAEGLRILDRIDPDRPLELGRVAGDFASVALEGALAVAGEADGGRVHLLDLSDPAAPRELAAFQRAAPARALALAGDSIFAVGGALDV
ncbi:MAG: IPT/TIG domain-containing protein, partial [Myxococcota bacterium]|nr:IPT/TIG domain-containing protein [Myxococcota bacterium]